MKRHARRQPYPRTHDNAEILPLNNRPTNQNDLLCIPGPPRERKPDRVRRREYAPRHASPVARASSSRPTPTENQPRWGACRTGPLAWLLAPGSRTLEADEDVRWDSSPRIIRPKERKFETSVKHGLPLWAEPAVGYVSRRPRPYPMGGSRFVGARAVGLWLGEQKPLGKTPLQRNPSPEMTYLPTSIFRSLHSSSVIPSSVPKSLTVSASVLLCVDELRSVRSLAGDAQPPAGPSFEVLHKGVQGRFRFAVASNCHPAESRDSSKDN